MGAYENPGAGRVPDKSLEINTAAMAHFSKAFAQGMLLYAAKKEQLRKESIAETNRVQLIGNEIQDKAFVKRNDNYKTMQELGVPITQQFKDLTDLGLMGRGERGDKDYVMGSIEARTILRTDPNLTTKTRQDLQNVINMSQNFQTNMVSNGGKLMTELALYTDTPPSEYNNNYRWAGRTQMERRASQYTAAVLNNEQIPGAVSTSKYVHPPNLQGTNVLTVTTLIDPKKAGKHAKEYENEELYPRNKDGYIEFKWEKDLNAWGEGLLEPIEKIADNIKIFQDAGIFKENGSLVDSQYVGGTTGSLEKIKGLGPEGYSELKLEKIVDVPGWRDNPTYKAMVDAQAVGFLGESNESLSATLENPLGLGPNFDMNRFRTGTSVKGKDKKDIMELFANKEFEGRSWDGTPLMQKEFLMDQIFDKYEMQKTNSFKKRKATQHDIDNGWAVTNPNEKDRKTNKWIVYYDGKEKVVQSKSQETTGLSKAQLKVIETRINNLEYPKTEGGKIDTAKLGSVLNDKGYTVEVVEYEDEVPTEVFIRKSSGKTTSKIKIEDDISDRKLNKILAQLDGVPIETSEQLYPEPDKSQLDKSEVISAITSFEDLMKIETKIKKIDTRLYQNAISDYPDAAGIAAKKITDNVMQNVVKNVDGTIKTAEEIILSKKSFENYFGSKEGESKTEAIKMNKLFGQALATIFNKSNPYKLNTELLNAVKKELMANSK